MSFDQAKNIWQSRHEAKGTQGPRGLAVDVATAFISSFQQGEEGDLRLIDLLCEMAMASDAETAKAATAAIFGGIIEVLCDDFSEEGSKACTMVLLRILDSVRKHLGGSRLNELLLQKGLGSTELLLRRFDRIKKQTSLSDEQKKKARKVFILSRVTAGADIAITGVFVKRIRKSLPQAEMVVIGPGHLPDMFGQTERCRFVPFIYKNDGSLIEKMTSWPSLLSIIEAECLNLSPDEMLLFDPDTRLSQLGLLPLAAEESTLYFPSRTMGYSDASQKNLSQLANEWLNQIFGEHQAPETYPLFSHLEENYVSFQQNLKKNRSNFIISINFGVGNDPRKKIGTGFELALLRELLKAPDTVIILDSGCGEEERLRTENHLDELRKGGFDTFAITKGENIRKMSLNHGIIYHDGPLGDLGKFIKISDCFVGYDSCGQHIASAARTPSVIIFAGAPSPRFVTRWSPNSQAGATIPLYRHSKLGKRELDTLLNNVVEAVTQIRKKQQPTSSASV